MKTQRIVVSRLFSIVSLAAAPLAVACSTGPGDVAADDQSAITTLGDGGPTAAPPPELPPLATAIPISAPAPSPCPGGKSVDMNRPPYSTLTVAELKECLGETAVSAIQNNAKALSCLGTCAVANVAYVACAALCGVSDVVDGVLTTLETGACFAKQYAARPIKLGCIYPPGNGVPGQATASCTDSSPNGVFDPSAAYAACRNIVNRWTTPAGNSCTDVMRNPIRYPDSESRTCSSWISACVNATKAACVPVPVGQ